MRGYPQKSRLGRSFFERPTAEVARELLGCHLVWAAEGESCVLRLVEVEAYLGEGRDPASHAHRGPTRRNAQMFETPGRLYVYFTYGMHHCINVVCEPEGTAGAVLLRAAEPLRGEQAMARRRGRSGLALSNGPAKLCQALGIDRSHDGLDLLAGGCGLWCGEPPAKVGVSARIGIRHGTKRRLRFFDSASAYVSRTRPAP